MTSADTLRELMRQALERDLTGARAYRFARQVIDDRTRSQQELEQAADELQRFLSAREGLDEARRELKKMEAFADSARLQDEAFKAGLRRLREALATPPTERQAAEAVVAEATGIWVELRKLRERFEETTADIRAALDAAAPARRTRISLLLEGVRFDIQRAAASWASESQVTSETRQPSGMSPEDDRLLRYRNGLLERARTALPEKEVQMYTDTFDRLSRGPDTPMNRRMLWAVVHQLRRRLFTSLELMQSDSTFSERATRPTAMRAIPNFWTAFQRLHELIQEGDDQVKYLLDQLVGALLAPEAERVRRTTVVCNVLQSLGKSEGFNFQTGPQDFGPKESVVIVTGSNDANEETFKLPEDILEAVQAPVAYYAEEVSLSIFPCVPSSETGDVSSTLQCMQEDEGPSESTDPFAPSRANGSKDSHNWSEPPSVVHAALLDTRAGRHEVWPLGTEGSGDAINIEVAEVPDLVAELEECPHTVLACRDSSPNSVEEYDAFFRELETMTATRCYKMVTLQAMIALDCLPGEVRVSDLAAEFASLALGSPQIRDDLSATLEDMKGIESLLVKNPIKALTGGFKGKPSPWFAYSGGVFRTLFEVADEKRQEFVRAVTRALDRRLEDYFRGKTANRKLALLRVSHAKDRPILFIDRDKYPWLPWGWTKVTCNSVDYEFNFVKIAVNQAREGREGENVLPRLLRSLLGERAGMPGRHQHVEVCEVRGVLELRVSAGAMEEQATGTGAFDRAKTKQIAVDRICDVLGIARRKVSAGGSEPAEPLVEACRLLELWTDGTKPELAERIAGRAGLRWDSSCDSRKTPSGGGSTVTLEGLNRVLQALELLAAEGALDLG